MKLAMITGVILFAFAAEGAMAGCSTPSTQVTDGTTPSLTTLLSGKTACVPLGAGWKFQEEHHGTGSPGSVLKDYKKGPSDAVDPTKVLGSWAVSGTGSSTIVTYDYGTGGTYFYTVWDNTGGSYSFCGTGGEDFTLKPIGAGC